MGCKGESLWIFWILITSFCDSTVNDFQIWLENIRVIMAHHFVWQTLGCYLGYHLPEQLMCPALDQLGKIRGSWRAHMGNSSQPACHWLLILARRKLVLAVIWELSRNFSGVSFFSTISSPLGLFSFLTVDSCVTRVSIPRDYSRNCKSLLNLDSRTLEQQFSTCGWDILHNWYLHYES